MTKLRDCACIGYNDKITIISALYNTKNKLEENTNITLDKQSDAFKKIMNEIIPEYDDLIKRISDTPDCKYEFE